MEDHCIILFRLEGVLQAGENILVLITGTVHQCLPSLELWV